MYSIESSCENFTNEFPNLHWTTEHGQSILNKISSLSQSQNQKSENKIVSNSFLITNTQYEISQKNKNEILDMSENLKLNSMVNTEWGPGKIILINKEAQIVKIRIEGQEQEFPFNSINPFLQIYVCIISENKIHWSLLKIALGENLYYIKNKIGNMYKVHPSRVLIIHAGKKIKDYSVNIYNLGIYEKDELLVVIREPVQFSKFRFKNLIKSNNNSGINSIRVKSTKNIIVTGIAFYKNDMFDVNYELIIKNNNNILYEDDIFVPKRDSPVEIKKEETYIVKYYLNKEIIFEENQFYDIQQNILNNNIKEQYIGIQLSENLVDENGVIITFIETQINKKNIKDNSTKVDQGLIPGIYYSFK